MKRPLILILLSIGMLVGCVNLVTAGEYKLIKGRDVVINGKIYPMCNDLLKSLNSFKNANPMVCERKFNEKFGFVSPNWKVVPKEKINWEILKQIYFSKNSKRFSENELNDNWNKERIRLEKLSYSRTILWNAQFDIDNNSDLENIVMLKDSDCSVEKYFEFNAPDPSLHVLEKNLKNIDSNYDILNYFSFDVFKYKNHTYLINWNGIEVKYSGAQLFVHDAFRPLDRFGFSNMPVCSYKFIK